MLSNAPHLGGGWYAPEARSGGTLDGQIDTPTRSESVIPGLTRRPPRNTIIDNQVLNENHSRGSARAPPKRTIQPFARTRVQRGGNRFGRRGSGCRSSPRKNRLVDHGPSAPSDFRHRTGLFAESVDTRLAGHSDSGFTARKLERRGESGARAAPSPVDDSS